MQGILEQVLWAPEVAFTAAHILLAKSQLPDYADEQQSPGSKDTICCIFSSQTVASLCHDDDDNNGCWFGIIIVINFILNVHLRCSGLETYQSLVTVVVPLCPSVYSCSTQ